MFGFFDRKRQQRRIAARGLFEAALAQSRRADLYKAWQVPDTIDGRFEMLALHGFLVVDRLLAEGREGRVLAQSFFDVMFRELEFAARNAGVGDLSVPRHVKRMMTAFHGRAAAYHAAFRAGDAVEPDFETLQRNLYGTLKKAPDPSVFKNISDYIRCSFLHLESLKWDEIKEGRITFEDIHGKKTQGHGSDTRMVA